MKKIIAYGVAALFVTLSGNALASNFPNCPPKQTVDAYFNHGCFTPEELCNPNWNGSCAQKLAALKANPGEYTSYEQECASYECPGYDLAAVPKELMLKK